MSKLLPIRKDPVPRRNDPCPCGSGKKAKRCCLNTILALASIPPALREQVIVDRILGRPIYVEPAEATSVEVVQATAE